MQIYDIGCFIISTEEVMVIDPLKSVLFLEDFNDVNSNINAT